MLGLIALTVFRFVLHECKIQVHIIPHSYDDSAWGKTVDEYLYPGIGQGPGVKGILDRAIQALKQNSQRTFVFAEMLFFKKWWEMQNKTIQRDVRSLVENKQLEFVNGGWVTADEGRFSKLISLRKICEAPLIQTADKLSKALLCLAKNIDLSR